MTLPTQPAPLFCLEIVDFSSFFFFLFSFFYYEDRSSGVRYSFGQTSRRPVAHLPRGHPTCPDKLTFALPGVPLHAGAVRKLLVATRRRVIRAEQRTQEVEKIAISDCVTEALSTVLFFFSFFFSFLSPLFSDCFFLLQVRRWAGEEVGGFLTRGAAGYYHEPASFFFFSILSLRLLLEPVATHVSYLYSTRSAIFLLGVSQLHECQNVVLTSSLCIDFSILIKRFASSISLGRRLKSVIAIQEWTLYRLAFSALQW